MELISETKDQLVFETRSIAGAMLALLMALVLIALYFFSSEPLSLEQTYVIFAAAIFCTIAALFIGRRVRITFDRPNNEIRQSTASVILGLPIGAIDQTHVLSANVEASAQSALEIRHKRQNAKRWQIYVSGNEAGKPWTLRLHKGTNEESAREMAQKINLWLHAD